MSLVNILKFWIFDWKYELQKSYVPFYKTEAVYLFQFNLHF
jgi:hypothetical protein